MDSPPPPPARKSIAVLPFLDMSPGGTEEYFCDGMTEEIIHALTKIEELSVTSRTSAFHFKNQGLPVREIGQRLNVKTVLEGSIRFSGNQFRLTAQLIDVTEDYHFFSETFDRSMEDIFAVQNEISLRIAEKLREHLGHMQIEDSLVEAPLLSVDAYKEYLRARFLILRMNKQDIEEGINILEKVLEFQPDFVQGHLGIHLGYTMMGTIGYLPATQAFERGGQHLEHAIKLDPDHPDCQLQLSYLAFLRDWDLAKAYQHLNRAFLIRPSVEYYQSMASILVAEGKNRAALNYIHQARQLDPFSNITSHLEGFIHYCNEDYVEAIQCFQKSIELNSGFMASTVYLGQAMVAAGQYEEAREHFGKFTDEEDLIHSGGMALTHAAMGKLDHATNNIVALEKALRAGPSERALNFLLLAKAAMNQPEEVTPYLRKAQEFRLPMLVYLFVDPLAKNLHALEEFKDLRKVVLGEGTALEPTGRKYRQQLFSKEGIERKKEELAALMESEAPYFDPELSLKSLAELMKLPANHLSQLLNEGFGMNFSMFIKSYRIEAFKSLAADPTNRHLTILGLAFEAGFNSKTTFNTFFRKTTGMTPKAYWKSIAKE
jgi:adenylate cyclase